MSAKNDHEPLLQSTVSFLERHMQIVSLLRSSRAAWTRFTSFARVRHAKPSHCVVSALGLNFTSGNTHTFTGRFSPPFNAKNKTCTRVRTHNTYRERETQRESQSERERERERGEAVLCVWRSAGISAPRSALCMPPALTLHFLYLRPSITAQ